MHILAPDPLGDAGTSDWPVNAPGWERFRTTVGSATPGTSGRIHVIEYGDVGAQGTGSRFLVAVWLPHELARVGRSTIDLLVWFTPNTNPPNYPASLGDYPYVLTAHGTGPYSARQPYVELPFAHWSTQHFLAYQLLAARRSAAIVIPVAPSSDFALWESPTTLMHMLKDICRWLPRDDDGRVPKIHPPPATVGRVGVAGFSSAVDRLDLLLNRSGPSGRYGDRIWGSAAPDHVDFDRAWRELWSIDGAFHGDLGKQARFLDKAAQWVRHQPDRRLRLYKNDFTDGRWDPRAADPRSAFGRAMRGARCVERGKDAHWAVFCAAPDRGIQALSMSKSYSVSGGVTGAPAWDNRPHENMPRLCTGHAFATSGFAPLGRPG